MTARRHRAHPLRDRGAVLPMVLVVSIVMALVITALATYTTTTLRYGRVSEDRADRFASAQAALDNAIERLAIKRSLCGTALGVGGVTEDFPEVINEAAADVTCRSVGGTAGDTEGWAVVLTGIGGPDYELVIQSGAGIDKYISGRIWMEEPTDMRLLSPLVIEDGDLWYPGGCDPYELTNLSASLDSQLSFAAGHGTMCTTGSWSSAFRAPATSTPSGLSPTNGATITPDAYGCTVFEPGRYTSPPVLGDFNYFKSGNYYFRNVGVITVKQKRVLFGNMTGVEGFPSIENAPCNFARGNDNTSGATVYVGGNTRFRIEAQGSLEFSRRAQIGSQKTDYVSLHVLNPGLGGQPSWSDPVLFTQSGGGKELAVQGLIWAPAAGLQFGEVTNDTTAALRGGAVLAKLDAGASASSTGFLIEVPTTETQRQLELTATATKAGATSIRAVLDWRVTNGETALQTWRVCEVPGC